MQLMGLQNISPELNNEDIIWPKILKKDNRSAVINGYNGIIPLDMSIYAWIILSLFT